MRPVTAFPLLMSKPSSVAHFRWRVPRVPSCSLIVGVPSVPYPHGPVVTYNS